MAAFRGELVNPSYVPFNILELETTMGYDIEHPAFPLDGQDRAPE